MASRARARLDQGGALVAGGTSTALTVTTNQALSSSHIANGLRLCVRTASAATGPATIAIDGLTAVDIKTNGLAAVASGDWASGAILDLVYSSSASAFIAMNAGPATGFSVSSLTTETALDHAADFVPVYDTSATANRKFLPRYFAPSVRASFHAHKNGTNQAVASLLATKVTFGTEVFDVGSAFASSTWTPPAGTVNIVVNVNISGAGSLLYVHLYKNGSIYKTGVTGSVGVSDTFRLNVIDQSNGSDTYDVYVEGGDGVYTVVGDSTLTFFCGSMA